MNCCICDKDIEGFACSTVGGWKCIYCKCNDHIKELSKLNSSSEGIDHIRDAVIFLLRNMGKK